MRSGCDRCSWRHKSVLCVRSRGCRRLDPLRVQAAGAGARTPKDGSLSLPLPVRRMRREAQNANPSRGGIWPWAGCLCRGGCRLLPQTLRSSELSALSWGSLQHPTAPLRDGRGITRAPLPLRSGLCAAQREMSPLAGAFGNKDTASNSQRLTLQRP